MLVVTGLGRCGTSLVMKWFEALGFNLGYNIGWNDEANAGLELSPVRRLNTEMYRQHLNSGRSIDLNARSVIPYWDKRCFADILQAFHRDPKQGDFIHVVKDPRLTWSPALLRAWAEARSDLKVLMLHRAARFITASRNRLPPQYGEPKTDRVDNEDQYRVDFALFVTEALNLEVPIQLVMYPNFCSKPQLLFRALAQLCPCRFAPSVWPELQEAWDEVFDPNLVHQSYEWTTLP